MSTVIDIFDREDIRGIIRDNCLRAEKGVGTVVLSPQKSGKSYLLEYIYNNRPEQANTFYCWISVNHLGTRGSSKGELSGETFLRHFLQELQEELKNYLARERQKEEDERAKLAKDEEQLKSGQIPDSDFQQFLEERVTSTKIYVREMEVLHNSQARIAALLAGDAQDDIYEFLDELLDDLKRVKKAVVVFIDDANEIVGKHEFGMNLLSLLRGASTEGKLVPLLSTPVNLMDPCLHKRERGEQARSLFNDLKVEVLNSFSDEQARAFLNWPKPPEVPFTDEEQQYLIDFAGGSPYFLREVRDRFLRPAARHARPTFESDVRMALGEALETVWSRCSPEQQEAVLAVYRGEVRGDEYEVDLGPVACFKRQQGFARILTPFLRSKAAEQPEVFAAATPAFSVFPMALCIADPGSLRPLVTIRLRNTTRRKVKVRLECKLQGFSWEKIWVGDIPPGKPTDIPLQITLKPDVPRVNNPIVTQIHWKAELNPGAAVTLIDEGTFVVRVLALDQFLFAYQDQSQNKLSHSAWLIASWVNTEDIGVRELARKATQEAQKEIGRVSGYPANSGPAAEQAVTVQVRELYNALRDRPGEIIYHNRTAVPFTDQFGDQMSLSQKVRLPGRSLKDGCANCLDNAVLFASLLSALDLDPVILFMPDHALVGWKTARGPTAELRFLDIIDVSDPPKDFAVACKNGETWYEKVKDLVKEDSETEIVNPLSFAVLVDIRAAQKKRKLGILPSEL